MNARELLESLNLLDEHERIEAKRGSEVGRSLLETVCAFANEPGLGGGWLLLGVVREELALFPAYEVAGLAQPDKVAADLATQCRDVFNVPVRVELATEEIDGQAVIVAHVPEAPPHDKPVYFKSRGLPAGALRRVGGTDQHCNEDDLLVLYQGRQHDSFDAAIVPDSTLADLAPEALVGKFINPITYMVEKFCRVWHRVAILQSGVAHAKEEPVPYRVVRGRVRRVESACHQIYVAVLRGRPSQDDPDGCWRHGQRPDRRAAGHATRGGQPVAPALLQGSIGGPRRESPPGTPPGLSPQSSRLRSRRSHASGRRPWGCRCRGSAWPTSPDTPSARAWLRASATARFGDGCTKTPSARGSTAACVFQPIVDGISG